MALLLVPDLVAQLVGKTGRVFCTAPSASDEEYELGPVAASLSDYLERWLQGEMLP